MKNQFKVSLAIFLLCFILLPTSFAIPAGVYKWKGKNGNVFYSDTPPLHGMDGEIKQFKEEPKTAEKPKPQVSSPQPQNEIAIEKRPYS